MSQLFSNFPRNSAFGDIARLAREPSGANASLQSRLVIEELFDGAFPPPPERWDRNCRFRDHAKFVSDLIPTGQTERCRTFGKHAVPDSRDVLRLTSAFRPGEESSSPAPFNDRDRRFSTERMFTGPGATTSQRRRVHK